METFSQNYLLLLGATMPSRETVIPSVRLKYPSAWLADITDRPLEVKPRGIDAILKGSPLAPEQALRAVLEHEQATGRKPIAAIPFSELTLDSAFMIAEHYNLRRIPRLDVVRDKLEMKTTWARNGLPVVRSIGFDSIQSLFVASQTIHYFPQIIKPRKLGGSNGVRLVRSIHELENGFEECRKNVEAFVAYFTPGKGDYLLEPFVDGHEISVEVLNSTQSRRVLGIVDKTVTSPPYFAETAHLVPSRLSGDPRIAQLASAACEALALEVGIAHVEMFVQGDKLLLSEVGARPAGDYIPDLLEMAFGVNLYALHVASYLEDHDNLVSEVPVCRGMAAVAFLKAPLGRIKEVRKVKSMHPNVTDLLVTARRGSCSTAPTSNDSREGVVKMFWPDRSTPQGPFTDHQDIASMLSEQLFSMEP